MQLLPEAQNTRDALDIHAEFDHDEKAVTAYVVGHLAKAGMKNREIRKLLNIQSVHACTDLKRIGTQLTHAQLELWLNNPDRIKLGHMRAISRLSSTSEREQILAGLLTRKIAARDIEKLAVGNTPIDDADIKRFEKEVSEGICRDLKLSFSSNKRSGRITLPFYDLEDLEGIVALLGFKRDRDF